MSRILALTVNKIGWLEFFKKYGILIALVIIKSLYSILASMHLSN